MNVFLKEKEAKENLISTALIGVGGYLVHMPPAYWLHLEPTENVMYDPPYPWSSLWTCA